MKPTTPKGTPTNNIVTEVEVEVEKEKAELHYAKEKHLNTEQNIKTATPTRLCFCSTPFS
jgi:hypothetical protein